MDIRFAQIEDIPGILDLLKQVGQVHHEGRPDIFRAGAQKYGASQILAMLESSATPIFVAVEGDFVAGYCFCVQKRFRDHETFTDRTEFYIDDLCVDENRRGQGIATQLFDHAVEYAKRLRFDAVTLNVWCGNDGAMKFYEKAGLKPRNIMMEKKLC